MKTSLTEEYFVTLAKKHYKDLEKLTPDVSSFYDYEKSFMGIMKEMTREACEKQIGKVPKDPRKKKRY